MSIERVKAYFKQFGMEDRVQEMAESSATVPEAAHALGVEEAQIAKTMSFHLDDKVILVVLAGDKRIDNPKYKAQFGKKAKMLAFDEAEPLIGHAVGGVCPFGINPGIDVYLDVSLKRFEKVYPACGSSNGCMELTIEELEKYSNAVAWVDVGK